MTDIKEISYKMHKTVFLLDKIGQSMLREHLDITYSQFMVMTIVSEHPGICQAAVAKLLEQTPAAISRQIDLLAEKGMLQKTSNPKNRREFTTTLTARGKAQLKEAIKIQDTRFENVFQAIAPKQRKELIASLDLVLKTVSDKGVDFYCHKE